MTKRILVGVLAALTAVAAWALPAPDADLGEVELLPEAPSGVRAAVWFCPGAAGEVDPILAAGTLTPGLVGFSLPMDGEILDSFQGRFEAGVAAWDVGDGLFFHPGPAIVETSTTPSATAVLFRGPGRVAGDGCYVAAKEWFLTGASIEPPQTLELRLFNPLLEPGRVDLELISEFGFEPLLDFESVGVEARSWVDVPLSLSLGNRAQVAVRVSVVEGVVIPSFHEAGPDGLAVWPGESPSARWEFPLAQVAGSSGTLAVWNPGVEPAEVSVRLAGRRGTVGRFQLSVAPGREERFDISSVSQGELGATLTSSAAVVAMVRSDAPGLTAATHGSPQARLRWLVPAHNMAPDLEFAVYVLNSGDEPAEVEIGPIGQESTEALTIPPEATVRVELPGTGAEVAATSPVAVSWLAAGAADAALAPGVSFGNE